MFEICVLLSELRPKRLKMYRILILLLNLLIQIPLRTLYSLYLLFVRFVIIILKVYNIAGLSVVGLGFIRLKRFLLKKLIYFFWLSIILNL